MCNKKWKKRYPNNEIYFNNPIDIEKVKSGKGSYGSLNIVDYSPNTGKSKLIIGNYCSIGIDNLFLLGGGHQLHHVSTYPFENKIFNIEESLDKGNIILEDDVWIGAQATIMSGVKIGQGAVIGTKALVTKDIPPYAIAVGIPAKVIKYRFSEKIINELLKLDYSKLTLDDVKENITVFTKDLTTDDLEILKKLNTSIK